MKLYLAKLVYQIICGEGEHTPQFDEQLRLIEAYNELEAFQKARTIGNNEAEAFYNAKEKLVQWKFIDVCEIHTLHELIDGAELYSQIREEEDAEFYANIVKLKAEKLLEQSANQCFQAN